MTPAARAFHILFLVAGLVVLCVGLYLGVSSNTDPGVSEDDIAAAEAGAPTDSQVRSSLRRSGARIAILQGTTWTCEPSGPTVDCESDAAELDLPSQTDLPVVVTLVGLGLLVASASLAAAGSARGGPAAQPTASPPNHQPADTP
jgi:hypothetical protein